MFMESPVKYAKSGDVHIAYRIFGDGPLDIVLVPGTLSHVELYWELPALAFETENQRTNSRSSLRKLKQREHLVMRAINHGRQKRLSEQISNSPHIG
jgi:hypothetical protein